MHNLTVEAGGKHKLFCDANTELNFSKFRWIFHIADLSIE